MSRDDRCSPGLFTELVCCCGARSGRSPVLTSQEVQEDAVLRELAALLQATVEFAEALHRLDLEGHALREGPYGYLRTSER
jgi:hypothetical protein